MSGNCLRRIAFCSAALLCLAGTSGCARIWNTGYSCWHSFRAHFHHRSMAIPDTYPLGNVNRAHYHTMQANAEASDFIIHRNEFVGNTAELTPFGKDHILEIAARTASTPFPVIIERTENNSDPERDEHRRMIVVRILTDLCVSEADARTFVAPAYGPGINSREGEVMYYQSRLGNFGGGAGYGANGNAGGATGGFGGGYGGAGAGTSF